jgi:hypothetical protein
VVSPEVNTEKTKYIVVSRQQNAGQDHILLIANKSFETVARFKYLETTVTGRNRIHEEINSILNSLNACYHSVQNPSSFSSPNP